jgi:hypothetical protein
MEALKTRVPRILNISTYSMYLRSRPEGKTVSIPSLAWCKEHEDDMMFGLSPDVTAEELDQVNQFWRLGRLVCSSLEDL